jgi:hypothetical protein
VAALKAKKPQKRNCEELERACEETRMSLCHNEKHKPHYSHYWIQSSCIYEFTGRRSTHFASAEPFVFCAAAKKEWIHNVKPAASSSTFAIFFYAVSSPPGRFNLGGPVPSSD